MKTKYFSLAAFSGLLTSLAIPNEINNMGYSHIGLIAYIPLFIALTKTKNKKFLITLTTFYFLIANSLQSFWLAFFYSFGIITFFRSNTWIYSLCFSFRIFIILLTQNF
ncbi:Apolipoprotein N-acyltransferase [Borrelia duttonii CR2A]|uniref:Apolipoprotein N-acyltransferase n=1 Tax=Borrelia duttonii CR2A TaxID=1432657 RepID=W6TYT8_9SPIR|nr:Apolipoprotein N-acyltransferase [Borrelia duttonii CR2A]